ncbi:MAG TPA: hypothetical protein VGS20_14925 [Candidatus Acidoferrales bacterium]|nr:hypothetical protein [Candidatus Acidoferrales bacterium]
MLTRLERRVLAAVAGGGVALLLILRYLFFLDRHPAVVVAIGILSPLVFTLVGVWAARGYSPRAPGAQPVPRTSLLIPFVLVWAALSLLLVARLRGAPAGLTDFASYLALVLFLAVCAWWVMRRPWQYVGMSRGRAAIVTAAFVVVAIVLYAMSHVRSLVGGH